MRSRRPKCDCTIMGTIGSAATLQEAAPSPLDCLQNHETLFSTRRGAPRRGGFTLVEILAMLPAVAVMLGTVSLTLCAIYKMDHQIRDSIDDQRQLEQLSIQLRQDAHGAVSAVVQESKGSDVKTPELILGLDDGSSVRYRLFSNRIDRLAYRQQVVTHRESYRVVCGGENPCSIDRDRPFPLITLDLQRPVRSNVNGRGAPLPIRLNAALRIVQHGPLSKR